MGRLMPGGSTHGSTHRLCQSKNLYVNQLILPWVDSWGRLKFSNMDIFQNTCPKNFESLLFAHLKISHLLIWLFNFSIRACLRIWKFAHLLNILLNLLLILLSICFWFFKLSPFLTASTKKLFTPPFLNIFSLFLSFDEINFTKVTFVYSPFY